MNEGAFKICAVEARRNSGALCIDTLATVAQLILSILPRAYRRHNEDGVIGSLQIVWV